MHLDGDVVVGILEGSEGSAVSRAGSPCPGTGVGST